MENHIEFLDGPDETCFRQEGPKLHHFRSTAITKEQELLEISWDKCLHDKVKIPATKLRGESGKWERPPTCCSVDSMTDDGADDDSSDEPQMEVGPEQETEELSDCDDEPEDDDSVNEELAGPSNKEIDEVITSEHPETGAQSPMEADSVIDGEELQRESEKEMNEETLPKVTQDNKRKRAEQDQSSAQEPPTKQQKSDTLVSKTAKAIEKVLGACEEVQKFEKLKQNVSKNPKSRYHIERYEAHLVKVQILTLKAFKKLFNDIQTWKENFKSSNQRDATEDDIRTSTLIVTKRNQMKIASELLKLWKITVHLI